MPDKTTAHVLACGTLHCDLTWLLLQPGRAITNRSNPAKPAEWIPYPTHTVVWDNQAWLRSVEKLRGIAERTNATLVFGHDPDQINELRIAPEGSYT